MGLDRKQRNLLSDILGKVVVYLTTIALIKQVLDGEFNFAISSIIAIIVVVLTIVAVIIVREKGD